MITQSDQLEVVYDMCRGYGVEVYMPKTFPDDGVMTERIVILGGRIIDGSIWDRSPIRVNWCVPDINGEPDLVRLKEVEHIMRRDFRRGGGRIDGEPYRFQRESMETVTDEGLKVHYVNVTLQFGTLNTN